MKISSTTYRALVGVCVCKKKNVRDYSTKAYDETKKKEHEKW